MSYWNLYIGIIIHFGSVNRRQTLDMTVTYQQNIMQYKCIYQYIFIDFIFPVTQPLWGNINKKQIQGALYGYLKRKTDKVTLVKKKICSTTVPLCLVFHFWIIEKYFDRFLFFYLSVFFLSLYNLYIFISLIICLFDFISMFFLFKPIGFKYILFHRI